MSVQCFYQYICSVHSVNLNIAGKVSAVVDVSMLLVADQGHGLWSLCDQDELILPGPGLTLSLLSSWHLHTDRDPDQTWDIPPQNQNLMSHIWWRIFNQECYRYLAVPPSVFSLVSNHLIITFIMFLVPDSSSGLLMSITGEIFR